MRGINLHLARVHSCPLLWVVCADCGDDAHSHAANCRLNPQKPNIHGTEASLNQAHRAYRKERAQAYLLGIADLDLRRRVGKAVKALLAADEVRVEDIWGLDQEKGGGGGR